MVVFLKSSFSKPPISPFATRSVLTVLKSRRFRVSARIARPSTRPNYLRKKLADLPLSYISKEKLQNSDGDSSFTDESDVVRKSEKEPGRVRAREVTLLNKFESWMEQYRKDTEFWGIGTGSIFTIFQDSEGKIERVVVDEDEIRRRSRASDRQFYNGIEDPDEVRFKISFAHEIATEIGKGNNVIPENSSVTTFLASGVASSHTVESNVKFPLQGISLSPYLLQKTSMVGGLVLCGLIIVQAGRMILNARKDNKELTSLEKKGIVKGSVEVMSGLKTMPFATRPSLDKEELAKGIAMAKRSADERLVEKQTVNQGRDLKDKIEEIRMMARSARKVERNESLQDAGKDNLVLEEASTSNVSSENEQDILNDSFAGKSTGEASKEKSNEANPVVQSGNQYFDGHSSRRKKLRIIKSAEEAREYLKAKHDNVEVKDKNETESADQINDIAAKREISGDIRANRAAGNSSFTETASASVAEGNADSRDQSEKHGQVTSTEVSSERDEAYMINKDQEKGIDLRNSESMEEVTEGLHPADENIVKNTNSSNHEMPVMGASIQGSSKDWIEKNFHEFDPIIKQMGIGFVENYQVAKERASLELESEKGMPQLQQQHGYEDELEWMKDEKLRNIVFRVRDNELSGKEPFHLISEEDKSSFFHGLGKKVEVENKKLLHLHDYLHSNIENLDYGSDGISLYDPPEKILPRWKIPPGERSPEFLNKIMDQREVPNSMISKKSEIGISVKAPETSSCRKKPSSTVIQGSDGSVRAGKRNGKEFWQHTKKWSQGFLECYNAETDPEVKAVMRDMGKDLDRWITEKEIKEAAELMDKLPEKGRDFIKRKLDKVKREMELYGPQAVVSKYREYSEQKEEDYLWWLDLPYVLCIEMYTVDEDGEDKVGLYSLEMGADLELDPKQYHVIAFEDAGDCKNLCYIIQAHLEMLGKGHAFVVARPPKDAFREAKANGFSVTVVRKGEVEMDVDERLEEVEEALVEVGSRIYHDKITRERSVDISALMKGVLGFSIPEKRLKKKKH